MNKISQCILMLFALVMMGCGGSSGREPVPEPQRNYIPELNYYGLVDSYGTDTSYSNAELVLDPYLDYGVFEAYWEVNSLEDYRINFYVNNYSDLKDSTLLHTQRCGAGLTCDQDGAVFCEYNADFTMSCDVNGELQDVGYLFDEVPTTLFLLMEVCDIDSAYCEFDYYPVIME